MATLIFLGSSTRMNNSWAISLALSTGRPPNTALMRQLDRYRHRNENFVLVVLRDQAAALRPTIFSN